MPAASEMPASAASPAATWAAVADYYTEKLQRHGATPAGVDWASATGQDLRFALLLKLCDFTAPFSLNDLGCGYGAILDYLQRRHPGAGIDYLGVDLSAAMVACAAQRWQHRAKTRFVTAGHPPRIADHAIASGIFNVVPPNAAGCWTELVAGTLSELHATTRHGFAVNFMRAIPGQPDQPGLYRTQPGPWITYCEQTMGATATLVEAYALGEFTLLVHPNQVVAAPGEEEGRLAPGSATARKAVRPSA